MNFLSFDKMITPKLIPILYLVMVVGVLYVGTTIIFSYFTFYRLGLGLFYIIFGILGARVSCELIIVIFKIYQKLHQIADHYPPKEE